MLPIEEPRKRRPKPRERSRSGSTRCIVCAAPGKLGPSAMPSRTRTISSTAKLGTTACIAAIDDHTRTDASKPRRAPARSSHQPASGVAIRYATEKIEVSQPYSVSEMSSALVTVGARTASVERSM